MSALAAYSNFWQGQVEVELFLLTLSSFWKYSLRKLTGLSGLDTQSCTMHSFRIF